MPGSVRGALSNERPYRDRRGSISLGARELGLTIDATLDEAGLPGFDISLWHGLWLPKGTPKNIIAKLNAAVTDALADPNVRARLADLSQEIFPRDRQTPEALGAFQKAEIEKWWPIVKAANIKGE
jgi:tripartite-type tricarboxylate transporter receptor subunit TctC